MDLIKNVQLSVPFQLIYNVNIDNFNIIALNHWLYYERFNIITRIPLNAHKCNGMTLLEFAHEYIKNEKALDNVCRLLKKYGYNVLELPVIHKYGIKSLKNYLPKYTNDNYPSDIPEEILPYVRCKNVDFSKKTDHWEMNKYKVLCKYGIKTVYELGYNLTILCGIFEDIKEYIPMMVHHGYHHLLLRYSMQYGYFSEIIEYFDVMAVRLPENISILTLCILFGTPEIFRILLTLDAKINTFDDFGLNWSNYLCMYKSPETWADYRKEIKIPYEYPSVEEWSYYRKTRSEIFGYEIPKRKWKIDIEGYEHDVVDTYFNEREFKRIFLTQS